MQIGKKIIFDATATELLEYADRIGQTPLQPIYLQMRERKHKVYLKLEGSNPTGSMKDRTGYALIQHLQEQGVLHKESVIIESSSGNLGVALAMQCKARGYGFVVVVDPKTTPENLAKMQAFGAQINMVHEPDAVGGYLLTRLARVQELCNRYRNYIWTDQYSSPANPSVHYNYTGPEVYQQMHGHVDAVFIPVSTGGTLAGISRFFRQIDRSTRIIGVDAYGSVIFGAAPSARKLTGIGSSRRSNFIHEGVYDAHLLVKDEEAFAFCRALYAATGIKVGGSSGAVLAACARYLEVEPTLKNIVCICADDGENYASTIFSDEWLQRQEIHLAAERLGPVVEISRD